MNKPNIIYILSDQHNHDVMGCSGNKYILTPNIDKLSKRGITFDNCYSASPLCVPSRMSILTGLLPTHTGIYNNWQCLSSSTATFAHALSANGYETVLCGRMHFVGQDQNHGFEKRIFGDITNSGFSKGKEHGEQIYGNYRDTPGQNYNSVKLSGSGKSAVLVFDKEVTDCACDFMKNRKDERPLFITVGYYGPHCPYIAYKELYQKYFDLLPEINTDNDNQNIHPAVKKWKELRNVENVTKLEVRRVRAAYYAMVEYLDGLIGKVIQSVNKNLDMSNTIIIYGSDHGDAIGNHGMFWKTNLYDCSSKIPLIIAGPDIPEDVHIKNNISALDIAPTILSITGSDKLPEYDGIDLSKNILSGKEPDEDRIVVSICQDMKGDAPSAMAKYKNYKLVFYAGYDDVQLFDLEKDPEEFNDVSKNGEYSAVKNKLLDYILENWDYKRAIEQVKIDKQHFNLIRSAANMAPTYTTSEWTIDGKENNYID